jgi:hypothetical protein
MKSHNEALSLFIQFKAAAENHCREKSPHSVLITLPNSSKGKLLRFRSDRLCRLRV